MDELNVQARPDGAFDVEVGQGARATRHVVQVPAELSAALGHPEVAPEVLVRRSFEFLLEREPSSSILAKFSLDVIERYFPEFRRDMARRLG